MKNLFSTKNLTKMAIMAAVYVVLTLAFQPLSFGPMQFRVSEIITILAFFNPIYVIAFTVGCLISNLFSPAGMYDIILGTAHTFVVTLLMWKIKNLYIGSTMPAVFSWIISIAICLSIGSFAVFFENWLYVGISELILVSVLGVIFALILIRTNRYKMFTDENFNKFDSKKY